MSGPATTPRNALGTDATEETSVQARNALILPSDHPPTDNARVVVAWKKAFLASGQWPWELLPENIRPQQWSQGLAEKFAQIIITVKSLDDITFAEVVSFIVEQIPKHTRKDTAGVFTPSDCDLARDWLEQRRRSHSRSLREPTFERATLAQRKRSSDRTSPALQDTNSTPFSRKRQKMTPSSPCPDLNTTQHDPVDSDPDFNTIHASAETTRFRSLSLGTPSDKVTPKKAYCEWLSVRRDHALTDLQDAREAQKACTEGLESQARRKESLVVQKQVVEKEVEDAKKHMDQVIQQGTTNAKTLSGLSAIKQATGGNCPDEIIDMFTKFEVLVEGQEAAVTRAKAELETQEARVQEVDQGITEMDVTLDQLTQRKHNQEHCIKEKEQEEKGYDCLVRIAKLGIAGLVEAGEGALDVLNEWIDLAEEGASRRESS
ncbi:hypothetical protein FSPOR_6454 [Fusarium sporotrichioides]|uniref:Uncharacterized protein n=1 Tax=Fusarium sporotrichioides TaxID=5514 RepID=A0A395S2Z0_FUSSP|nr:hypothetical protein FSPOR_6454 [Fusarium sporotrichioides]